MSTISYLMFNLPILALNLQIFGTPTGGVQTTGMSGLTPEMKTYYDMTLLDEAGPNLLHMQFGQKRPIPKGKGKTIEFRKFTPLIKALTPLTEGVTPKGNDLKVTALTATVKQYGDFISQSDVLELTAIDNTIVEATKLLGRQAGLTLDTIVREILQAGDNVSYCPKIGAGGAETPVESRTNMDATSALTVKQVQKAATKLKRQNAPKINGSYIGIIHPDVAFDLMRDPEWADWSKYTNPEHMYEGEIGRIAGVRFVESSEAKIYTGGDCPSGEAVYGTLIFGDGAFGTTEVTGGGLQTIVKQKGSAGTADPLDQRSSVGWKAMLTAEILIPQYLVRVESCSPAFSKTAVAN